MRPAHFFSGCARYPDVVEHPRIKFEKLPVLVTSFPPHGYSIQPRERASTHEVAVWLAALNHLAAIRIERVVDDPLRCIVFIVVLEAEMAEAFGHGFQTGPLRLMVQTVVGIGAVNDPPQQHQSGIIGELTSSGWLRTSIPCRGGQARRP